MPMDRSVPMDNVPTRCSGSQGARNWVTVVDAGDPRVEGDWEYFTPNRLGLRHLASRGGCHSNDIDTPIGGGV